MKVSKLGVGTNAVGGHNLYKNLDEENGKAFLREALKNEINFIDTADVYGEGRSEELVGKVLKEFERDSFFLATKGGQTQNGPNNHPNYMRKAVESSLKRLKMNYIDLYYLHFPDNKTPLVESIGELSRLVEEGKILSIGVSNLTLEQLKEANSSQNITAFQYPYNLLNREAEKELLPYCIKNNISFIPYGPLAFGILGGNYDEHYQLDEGDWRRSVDLFKPDVFKKNIEKANMLKEISAQKGHSISEISIAWLMSREGVDTVIPGGKRPSHIQKNIGAVNVELTELDLEEIDSIFQ